MRAAPFTGNPNGYGVIIPNTGIWEMMKVPAELLAKSYWHLHPANDQVFGRSFTNRVAVIVAPIRLDALRLNRQRRSIYNMLFLQGRI